MSATPEPGEQQSGAGGDSSTSREQQLEEELAALKKKMASWKANIKAQLEDAAKKNMNLRTENKELRESIEQLEKRQREAGAAGGSCGGAVDISGKEEDMALLLHKEEQLQVAQQLLKVANKEIQRLNVVVGTLEDRARGGRPPPQEDGLETVMDEAGVESGSVSAARYQEIQQQLQAAKDELREMTKENAALKVQRDEVTAERDAAREEGLIREEAMDALFNSEDHKLMVYKLEAELEERGAEAVEAQTAVIKLKKDVERLERAGEEAQDLIHDLEKQVKDKTEAVDRGRNRIREAEQKNKELQLKMLKMDEESRQQSSGSRSNNSSGVAVKIPSGVGGSGAAGAGSGGGSFVQQFSTGSFPILQWFTWARLRRYWPILVLVALLVFSYLSFRTSVKQSSLGSSLSAVDQLAVAQKELQIATQAIVECKGVLKRHNITAVDVA